MGKRGDTLDEDRRRKHVSGLQDLPDWRKYRKLPPANATWPTCLVIAPSSVVGNWEREFQTVSDPFPCHHGAYTHCSEVGLL